MTLPLIPQDKANHMVYGAMIGLAAGAAAHVLGVHPAALPVIAAAAVGALKEIDDWLVNREARRQGLPAPHGVEFWDFGATALGGAAVSLAAAMG